MNPERVPLKLDNQFVIVPRDYDSAVIYWNVENLEIPYDTDAKLLLRITNTDKEDVTDIILHRERGHYIIPLTAQERNYKVTFGWEDFNGFNDLHTEEIELPNIPDSGNLPELAKERFRHPGSVHDAVMKN